ncbi:protein translocase subunit SecA [Planctomycetales bacterium]|nr:protein translocase subunit SecA [Planctomycetales bacterium]GHT04534.1 protein translocase subunit SecA [Planctomycetales bacterium]GHV18477.1 protein translocase subunit SecA [Planctomycetales bacterium]
MSITESILEGVAGAWGKIFGTANERELARLWPLVEQVNVEWGKIRDLPDAALFAKTTEFRRRLVKGETEDQLLPEAFAVCREASHRTHGGRQMIAGNYSRLEYKNGKFTYLPEAGELPFFAHFDVQVIGGIVLHQGKIAEMVTGEGKTLVATLPCYLNALRPTEEWVAKARELQGDNVDEWQFKPYGQNADGAWSLVPRLTPPPEDVTAPRPPDNIIPVAQGVHVVTVNDYLAARDAAYNRPLFAFLDLEVGAIQSSMDNEERRLIYFGDIVYGTNNEFGFDYLRDNLKVRLHDQAQRARHYAIVDEVDSVLIDEARTPLIISGSAGESTDKYFAADTVARRLTAVNQIALDDIIDRQMKSGLQREQARIAAEAESGADYVFSERDHSVKLTEKGTQHAIEYLGLGDIYSGANMDLPHFIDNALKAHSLYKRDVHYLVKDGQVFIVDEFTGRVLEGRRWSDGLHQAVEAKEQLRIKEESQTVATITFQNFFRLYEKLGGMTGTAMTEAKEFFNIYKLGVVSIPTNRPLCRKNYPDLIYGTIAEKWTALADHVLEVHRTGRPILIGTVSIEHSEIVANSLRARGIKHEVLNAKNHAREAEIVALAGQLGQVTVATNMAGRGTDIQLGNFTLLELVAHWQKWGLAPKKNFTVPENGDDAFRAALQAAWVKHYLPPEKGAAKEATADYASKSFAEWEAILQKRYQELGIAPPVICTAVAAMGGLHIVGSERHESRRIDNQLRGRAGRQGDPGSSRFFLSLDDDIMRLFAPERVRKFMQWAGLKDGMPIESAMVTNSVEKAQRKVEERNFEMRKNVLEYDEVMNEQRLVVYRKRQAWLADRELKASLLETVGNYIAKRLKSYAAETEAWNDAEIADFFRDDFLTLIAPEAMKEVRMQADGENKLLHWLQAQFAGAYDAKERQITPELARLLEKMVLLEIIDRKWMDHLYAMDLLKEGIHLRGYAGQDPKIRYKLEGFEMFQEMWDSFETEVAQLIMKVRPLPPPAHSAPAVPENGENNDAENYADGLAPENSAAPLSPSEAVRLKSPAKIQRELHGEFDAMAEKADKRGRSGGGAFSTTIVNRAPRVGDNAPCPCGSGKKYKKCHGRGR